MKCKYFVAALRLLHLYIPCLHNPDPHLFCEAEYLEQDLPSQAQYGSLARQQSAQTSPYTSHRWRAKWVTPRTDPTYNCCC